MHRWQESKKKMNKCVGSWR